MTSSLPICGHDPKGCQGRVTVTPGAGAGSWAECPCDAAAGRLARVFVPDPEESRATRRLGHGTGVGRGPSVEGQARRGGADFCATGQGTPGGMGCSLGPLAKRTQHLEAALSEQGTTEILC